MATTLTDKGDLLYASFPIEKTEVTDDGDLVVYGKASDGGLDSDNQIVDPSWMSKAVQEWLATGANLRVQHSAQRDPAGIGLEASTDNTGATWVKGLVVEPIAQKLVSKGALRAYSVGIARPTIVRDAMAPGGRITGGELVEVSLVDRPANKRCGIQLVKSADDGTAQWVGKMFGDEAEIEKALSADVTKTSSADMTFEMPGDMSITFTPNDLAKILKNKIVEQHYGELAMKAISDGETEVLGKDHREFSADERRHNASAGNALSDGSYPIPDKDALRRAAILARSKHGNWQAASRLIARRARELGVPNPMDDNDSSSKGEGVTDAPAEEVTKNDTAPEVTAEVKEAEPALTKEPADADDAPKPKKGKKGKKLPAFLQQVKAATPDDADDDDSGDGDETDDTCKLQHTHTEKCMPSGTPQSASGAKDAPAMTEMPDPNAYQHTPMPAGRATPEHKAETAAMLRFKTIGIDTDLGRLHDLTCPAYHPEDVAKYHPFASLENVIDTGVWQRKAVDAACGPIEHAMTMTQVWQAAETLKGADMADLNDYRLEMHKAFRDANPGPVTYPSPGSVSPSKFNRPCITEGQAARSPGYGAPNSSPAVAGGPVTSAHGFTRPPLGAGHQSPSPSFMKADFEYPSQTGMPVRLNYAQLDKERARSALSYMHDHLAHAFPMSCPMLDQDATRVDNSTAPPPTAGVSKSEDTGKAVTPAAVFKAPVEDEFASDEIYKAFKKMRKKLGKKVLSGKMTVDEARSKLGRNFAQKDEAPETVKAAPGVAASISETPEVAVSAPPASVDPEVIKSAVTDAVKPFLDQLTKAEQKIQDQQAVLDKIANMPDPSTAAFTGLAVNPVRKSARPAGVPSQAEVAERTQQMIIRQLERTWRTSENPAEREAARGALDRYQGVI